MRPAQEEKRRHGAATHLSPQLHLEPFLLLEQQLGVLQVDGGDLAVPTAPHVVVLRLLGVQRL